MPFALPIRSEEHTSELQSHDNLVCRLLLEKNNRSPPAPRRPPPIPYPPRPSGPMRSARPLRRVHMCAGEGRSASKTYRLMFVICFFSYATATPSALSSIE